MKEVRNLDKSDCEPFAVLGRARGLEVHVGAGGT